MLERAHPNRRQRAGRPRTALAVLGKLNFSGALFGALVASVVAAACDQGEQHDVTYAGPALHIVAANVGPSRPLPADGVIRVTFDRLLLPSSVNRQGISVVDAFNTAVNPEVSYDPTTRTVTLGPQGTNWLKPDQPYRVVTRVPADDQDPNGLRAIDRAPLFASDPLRQIGFMAAAPTGAAAAPAIDFCRDVAPVFQQRCSASTCHGGSGSGAADPARFGDGPSRPAAGLVLETTAGVAQAIGRVANGANTGPRMGVPLPTGRLFGLDMALVTPYRPDESWLLYKLLLAVPSDPASVPASFFGRCDAKVLANATTTCASNQDCTAGRDTTGVICGTSAFCTDGCARDADCSGGACDPAKKTCAAPPPPLGSACGADGECGGGYRRVCDRKTHTCAVPLYDPPLAGVLSPEQTAPMSDGERSILSDLVLGREMPYPDMGPDGPARGNPPLTLEELARVSLWIAEGAKLAGECTCAP